LDTFVLFASLRLSLSSLPSSHCKLCRFTAMKQSGAFLVLLLACCRVEARKTYAKAGLESDLPDLFSEMPGLELPAEGLEDIAQSVPAVEPDVATAATPEVVTDANVFTSSGFEVSDPDHMAAALPELQSHLDKVSEATSASHEKLQALQNMETSVLNMAKNAEESDKPSEKMITLIGQIREKLEDMLLPELKEHQKTMDEALDECATNLANCNLAWPDIVPDYIDQPSGWIPGNSTPHRTCRQAQCAQGKVLGYSMHLLSTKYDVKKKWCDLYDLNESGSNAPGSECEVDLTLYTGTYWSIDYYGDQYDFWSSLYRVISAAKLKCEEKTTDYDEQNTSTYKVWAKYNATKNRCEYLQDEMDDASCELKAILDPHCRHYTACYNDKMVTYNQTWIAAKELEVYLRDQMHAVLRIFCYLDAFTKDDLKAEIQRCRFMEFEDPGNSFLRSENITSIFFTDRLLPLYETCPYPWAYIAENQEYENQFYNDTCDLATPCDSTCCRVTRVVTYTTTTTTHPVSLCVAPDPESDHNLEFFSDVTEVNISNPGFEVKAVCKESNIELMADLCEVNATAYTFPTAHLCAAQCVAPAAKHANYAVPDVQSAWMLSFRAEVECTDGTEGRVLPCKENQGAYKLTGCEPEEEIVCVAPTAVPDGHEKIEEFSVFKANFSVRVTCESGQVRFATACQYYHEAYTLPQCQ